MYRFLLLLIVIFSSSTVTASPYRVTTASEISHGNWTPIPEQEMRAAAVDNALAEISKRGLFKLVEQRPIDGELLFTISLIGEAQVVKMTIALHLDNTPSYLATTSVDVRNLDRQQIYQAFEYVGIESAKQLNAKVELAKRSPTVAADSSTASSPTEPNGNPPPSAASPMTLQRFNQAHSLNLAQCLNCWWLRHRQKS